MLTLEALEQSTAVAALIELTGITTAPASKFDNRDTWDNRSGGGFDNRPSWDNWNKK
ncbi:hypothetical protein CLV63_110172 [Murinocardiopsis flavida]|uniref:Uncharacterized protein n=1 Tax=Murinocardiopsis flavida TaxID=645275 RepID=A0A2P8DI29_9ACTN|nr:multiple cyclophane-containing RiPP AmcA [Murinocardiopsis flavida]PSK96873.1 hypothetical protein CLV63_110172 [Murinocardiopsis flavida]